MPASTKSKNCLVIKPIAADNNELIKQRQQITWKEVNEQCTLVINSDTKTIVNLATVYRYVYCRYLVNRNVLSIVMRTLHT